MRMTSWAVSFVSLLATTGTIDRPARPVESDLTVVVDCPSSGNLLFPVVTAPDKTSLAWGSSIVHNWAKGALANVATYTTTGSAQNQGPSASFSTARDNPGTGAGVWYLFRKPGPLGVGLCNERITWGQASRDAVLP